MADDIELAKPQRFPLTGDGPYADAITSAAIQSGREVTADDLVTARYRDHRRSHMVDPTEVKAVLDAYWNTRMQQPLTEQQQTQQLVLKQSSQRQTRGSEHLDERQGHLTL